MHVNVLPKFIGIKEKFIEDLLSATKELQESNGQLFMLNGIPI